ncbi:hypothetical protein [Candidatus Nucleicultrix amoebiphila]|jgi:hypothetical protein|uniref:Alpha/beta hydrolase n=1 Tax=Candidatus Nucleicultrix amoebiphila FS5 TaxID=1414854 RepID=A0A1W6N4T0_9PROT|nr:hypothetical protein [Candidatus Nucleicultrix amoebiphila]ARN84822.1 hypothetical protein GQ61_05425 [Candidatus Nucleicultrix amoebiphila FS5]
MKNFWCVIIFCLSLIFSYEAQATLQPPLIKEVLPFLKEQQKLNGTQFRLQGSYSGFPNMFPQFMLYSLAQPDLSLELVERNEVTFRELKIGFKHNEFNPEIHVISAGDGNPLTGETPLRILFWLVPSDGIRDGDKQILENLTKKDPNLVVFMINSYDKSISKDPLSASALTGAIHQMHLMNELFDEHHKSLVPISTLDVVGLSYGTIPAIGVLPLSPIYQKIRSAAGFSKLPEESPVDRYYGVYPTFPLVFAPDFKVNGKIRLLTSEGEDQWFSNKYLSPYEKFAKRAGVDIRIERTLQGGHDSIDISTVDLNAWERAKKRFPNLSNIVTWMRVSVEDLSKVSLVKVTELEKEKYKIMTDFVQGFINELGKEEGLLHQEIRQRTEASPSLEETLPDFKLWTKDQIMKAYALNSFKKLNGETFKQEDFEEKLERADVKRGMLDMGKKVFVDVLTNLRDLETELRGEKRDKELGEKRRALTNTLSSYGKALAYTFFEREHTIELTSPTPIVAMTGQNPDNGTHAELDEWEWFLSVPETITFGVEKTRHCGDRGLVEDFLSRK